MAKSGTVETADVASTYHRTVKFTWNGTSSGNKTTINWTLSAGGSERVYGVKITTIELKVNNKVYFSTTNYEAIHTASRATTYTPYGETIKTGSFTITHDANGEAQMSVSLKAFVYSTTSSKSVTFNLEKLATSSSLNLPTFTLGAKDSDHPYGLSTITIYQGKDKTTLLSYGHKLKYKIGSSDYKYITAKQNGSDTATNIFTYKSVPSVSSYPNSLSVYFDPPDSDYQYASNGSLNGTIVLETYSDSTCSKLIGTNTMSMSIVIPDSLKPSISNSGYILDNSKYPLANNLNIALSNITTINLRLDAVTNSNAKIDSINVSNGGVKSYKPSTQVSSLAVTNELGFVPQVGGVYTYDVNVKDNKGFASNSVSIGSINVLPYDVPKIDSFVARRRGSSTTIAICCEASFASVKVNSVEKNSIKTISLSYREYGTTNWINYTGVTITNGVFVDVTNFDNKKKYELKISVTDAIGGVNELVQTVSKAETYIHMASGGFALGIGKTIDYEDKQKRVELHPEWELRANVIKSSEIDTDDIAINNVGSVKELINHDVYFHNYGITSGTKHANDDWRTYTSSNPSWEIRDGIYRVTATIAITGKSTTSGVATCRFCGGGAVEQWSDDQRTRATVPIMNNVRSAINVNWYFDTATYGNSFAGYFTIWCNTSWEPHLSTITVERVSDSFKATT